MKNAVLDIGSNSVRLMMISDGKTLYKDLNTCRLGEKIAFNGFLLDEAIDRTVNAILSFKERSIHESAQNIYAFATAAVRSANNSDKFLYLVKEKCGIDVDVISGEEEAEIGLLGALGQTDGGILDVGGASTELILRQNGNIIFKKSIDIGAVRLFDLCGHDRECLQSTIDQTIDEYGDILFDLPIYGIGGTATSLACIFLNLKEYDSNLVDRCVISIESMQELTNMLFSMSVDEITKRYCVGNKRAEIIAGGALLIFSIMKKLNLKNLIVSESDNLEGYAIKKGIL